MIIVCLVTGLGKEGVEEKCHWTGTDGEEKEREDVFVIGTRWVDDLYHANLLRIISDDLCLSRDVGKVMVSHPGVTYMRLHWRRHRLEVSMDRKKR